MSANPDKVKFVDPNKVIRKSTQRTKWVADLAGIDGVTPLEVMLDNMRYWHNKAQNYQAEIIEILSGAEPRALKNVPRLVECLETMNGARKEAQVCAVDAAPFMHPRLAAVQYRDRNGEDDVEFTMEFTGPADNDKLTVNGKLKGNGKTPTLDAHLVTDVEDE